MHDVFTPVREIRPDFTGATPLHKITQAIDPPSTLLFAGNPVAGEYSIDALCPPVPGKDYLGELVAVGPVCPARHICRVFLSLEDRKVQEVFVVPLSGPRPTIRELRTALRREIDSPSCPALRGSTTMTQGLVNSLVFLNEAGKKLDDSAPLPDASPSAMRDLGRHSAVLAQLAVPKSDASDAGKKLAWSSEKRAAFEAHAVHLSAAPGATVETPRSPRAPPPRLPRSVDAESESDDDDDVLDAGRMEETMAEVKQEPCLDVLGRVNAGTDEDEDEEVLSVNGYCLSLQEGGEDDVFGVYRGEFKAQLRHDRQSVPETVDTAPLQHQRDLFERLEQRDKSNAPLAARRALDEVRDSFDALEPNAAEQIAELFAPARKYAETIVNTPLETHNSTETMTDPLRGIKNLSTALKNNEKLRLGDPETTEWTDRKRNDAKDGPKAIKGRLDDLRTKYDAAVTFERERSQRPFANLLSDFERNNKRAAELQARASAAASNEDEAFEGIKQIAVESAAMHELADQQIAWARENTALARRNAADKISRLDAEIARLQAAREHEKNAADALGLHAAALRAKQVLERRKAAQFQREVMNAACDASKRLRRAEKFKDATTIARKQVTEVQKQVREEVAGLATYALELKKSIGVDVAAFYAMAAKFNFIETTQTESTREKSSRRLQKAFAKYQAALTDLDDDLAETVEAKQEAEEKLAAEKDKFATVEKKLEDLTTERTAIETAYEEVKTFLDEHRGGKKHMQVYKLDEVDTVPTWLDTQRDDGGDVRRELEDPREFEVDFKGRFERRDENADQGGMRRFMNFMGLGNQITGA